MAFYGVQAPEPFEEASSPPTSPTSTSNHGHNPYESSLARHRSSSIGSSNHGSITQTSPTRGFSLRRKKSESASSQRHGHGADGRLMRSISGELENGVNGGVPVTSPVEPLPEVVEEPAAPPPPAWKRRTSQVVKDNERKTRESLTAAILGGVGGNDHAVVDDPEVNTLAPPTAAFAKSGSSRPSASSATSDEVVSADWSPKSSTSSLRSTDRPAPIAPSLHSRRSSAYGAAPSMTSPLSKTAQEHEHTRHLRKTSMVGGPEGMVPDMSNPTTPSGERPLDTIRRMSMLSDGRDGGAYPATKRKTRSSMGTGQTVAAKRKEPPTPMGILMDDSIWPSMPSEPILPPKPIKSRSVISLTSLNSPSSITSKSTPASPVTPKKTISRSSSRSNISGGAPLGQGLTMTAANRQQYIQTMQRDYSMRLGGLGRDGGYAIAATMNAPSNGLHSNRGSVTDFGTMRYSGDWSGSGFYDDGNANSSRPSLPAGFHSNATSTTSLSLAPQTIDPYPASISSSGGEHLPGSYPSGLPNGTTGSHALQKTPSPLSQTIEGDQTPMRSPMESLEHERESETRRGSAVVSTPPAKSKKELAKETKEAKARTDREAKEKAALLAKQRLEAEKQKKLQAKLDKERAKAEKKAKKNGGTSRSDGSPSMPSTPLKGKTQALAGTPTTAPATPIVPPVSIRPPDQLLEIDNRGEERQMPSGLGQSMVTAADLERPVEQPVSSSAAPAEVTPVVQAVNSVNKSAQQPAPASRTAAPSPMKKKRSFWDSMRQMFGGAPPVEKQPATQKTAVVDANARQTIAPMPDYASSPVTAAKTYSSGESNTASSDYPSTATPAESVSTAAESAYANLRVQTPPPNEQVAARSPEQAIPSTPTRERANSATSEVSRLQQSPVSPYSRSLTQAQDRKDHRRSIDTYRAAQATQLPISRQTSAASHEAAAPPPSLGQVV